MVSVVIPTYNRASLLPRAIESVLAQTFGDLEVLVSDDGSTDNTEDVVKQYVQRDNRVGYIAVEHSGGAARPKNAGIAKAKGEYVAFLDSDDEWAESKLERQLAVFAQNPELGAVFCDFTVVDSETGRESPYVVPRYKNPLRQLLMRDYMGPGSCTLYPRGVFDEVGMFDEKLKSGQDREMRIRVAERFSIGFAEGFLVKYYVGHDNISTELELPEREEDWERIFEKHRPSYLSDRALWSDKLQYDGTRYVLLGELGKGRKRFMESLAKNPLNHRSLLSLLLSLFGKRAYLAVTRLRMAKRSRGI